jgi:spore coat protein CotH
MDKLHLNNSAQDPSFLCEVIGRESMQAAGIPTGRAGHALVKLNGRDLGLFVLIEGYDRKFLQRHFKNTDGNLYDSEFRHDISEPLKRSSGDGPNNHVDLQMLTDAARAPDLVQRMTRLSQLLDLDRFYSMLALESLMRHHDGYALAANNYWLYFDKQSGKAVVIPHGMDQIFYEDQAPLLP